MWRGNLVDGCVYVLQGVCVLQGDCRPSCDFDFHSREKEPKEKLMLGFTFLKIDRWTWGFRHGRVLQIFLVSSTAP